MRWFRQSNVPLFLAVVALCLAPVSSAFACGPCLDECCAAAKMGGVQRVDQQGKVLVVIPESRVQEWGAPDDSESCVWRAELPVDEPLHAPLRI